MDYGTTRTWLEVDLRRVADNYRRIREHVDPAADIIIVVKADAYGLGAVQVAKTLEAEGCRHFATAYLQEAVELRENGIKSPILILGSVLEDEAALAIEYGFEVAVSDAYTAEQFGRAAHGWGSPLQVQIAVDVGMSRFGIRLENRLDEAVREAEQIIGNSSLRVRGVFSHMTGMAYPWQREFDLYQLQMFRSFVTKLRERGSDFPAHCACSAITLLYPEYHMDAIRVSALPFGLQNKLYQDFEVGEVIQLKSRIRYLKEVPIHTSVGYGPDYTTRKTKLAILPVGFGDGLHRSISNRAEVLVHGQRVRIFGKLCMDFTMIDVTDIPDVQIGDEVVLFGEQDGSRISIQEYAGHYNGTACEVSVSLGKRINRIYLT